MCSKVFKMSIEAYDRGNGRSRRPSHRIRQESHHRSPTVDRFQRARVGAFRVYYAPPYTCIRLLSFASLQSPRSA